MVNERWQQGRLLLTNETVKWSQEMRDRYDADEKRMVFARFDGRDDGQGRVRICICETAEMAARIVKDHNASIQPL